MKKKELWQIQIGTETYPVTVNYRKRRSMGLRYNPERKDFTCNVPIYIKEDEIFRFVNKNAEKLIERVKAKTAPNPIEGDFVYLFGERYEIPAFSTWKEEKQRMYLKKILLSFLEENVAKNKEKMGVTSSYRVRVRQMKTRWGVNNQRTLSLTFALCLVHYSKEIIESVVIHELAHDKVRNHSKNFYKIVLAYYPNYYFYHKKLTKGQYK